METTKTKKSRDRIRKKRLEDDDDGDGVDGERDKNGETEEEIQKRIIEKRNEQILRKRQRGLEAQTIFEQNSHQQNVERSTTTATSIKSMIGSQFSIQNPGSSQGILSHKNILEKFIQEKIGAVNSSLGEKNVKDELFQVSDELKALEGEKTKVANVSELGIAWTTGLAEVALPIDYKLQNIEATELVRKKIEEGGLTSYNNQQFNKTPALGHFTSMKNGRSQQQSQGNDGTTNQAPASHTGLHRNQMSTDDVIFDRFRKRERERR